MALNDRGRDLTGAVVEGSGGSELVSAGPGGAAAGGGVSLVLDAGSAGGSLVVPGGAFLLVADYVREGPDLLLIGGDGRQVLIRDYFASETPPDLVSEGGARVSGDLAEALAGPAAPGQVAQAAPAAAAQPIGRVDTVEGEVVVARADGTQVSLTSGSPVFQGDVLETGSGASLGIVFVDDTTFSLGEDARMVLDELIYDPSTNTGSSAFSVVQGVFVFVSGEIAKSGDQAMVVTTPVGSIGIRGTTVAAEIAAEGEQSTITLLPDEDGSTGEIVFTNGGGTQFINIAYQQITATSFSVAPSAPEIKTAAEVEAQYGAALSALPAQAAAGAQDDGTAGEPGAADGEDGEGEGEDEGGEEEDGEVDPEALGELAPAAGEEGGDGGGTTFITPTPDTSASTPTLDLDPDTAGNQLTGTTSGDEDSAIALDIDAALTDLDGSETLSVTITGIPDNATINLPSGGITFDPSGTDASPNTLLLANVTPGDLEGLSITPPPDFFGSFDLEITATAIEGASGATAPVTGTLTVNVADVAELPVEPPPEPEPEPSEFAIADATGSENPGAAIFTVTRTGDLSGTVSVDYQTNAVTATEGVDYTGAAGTLTFEPGVAELTIEVDVTADNLYEPVERFEITLSNPTGDATIADGEADGRILNNAHAPTGELHPGGLVNGFGFTISGIHENDESGTSVSGAGDVNNDGFADLLIGAPHGGVEEDGEGYIIFGGPDVGADGDIDLSSLDGTNGYVFIGDTEGDNAGTSVSGIGDVNDDGFDDFIIGAPHAQGSSLYDAGESYVIFGDHLSELDGNADGVIELSSLAAGDGSHGFVLNGLDNFDDSGHAVSGIGDVNGDGIDDFVIGAPYADRNEDDREGESYVVFGGSGIGSGGSLDLGGLDGDNGFRIIGDDRFDGSGRSVSGAGDVNGDGVDDLIIGAPYADPNGTGLGFGEEGESYVIFGKLSTESFAATIDLADITASDGSDGFVLNGVQEADQAGYAVSSAGDVNGDGFADLLIGAWEANRGFEGSDRGEAYVVFGSDDKDGREMIGAGGSIELSDLDGSDGFKITGLNEFDYVGFSVPAYP